MGQYTWAAKTGGVLFQLILLLMLSWYVFFCRFNCIITPSTVLLIHQIREKKSQNCIKGGTWGIFRNQNIVEISGWSLFIFLLTLGREKKLLNKVFIFVFFAHKKYSHSFITLRLNHWCHMDYFNNVLTTFLSLKHGSCVAVYAESFWISSKISQFVFWRWSKFLRVWNDMRVIN